MKTMEELYKEVMASDELKKEFLEAVRTKESVQAFLKKYECTATVEELKAFLNTKTDEQAELSDEEIAAIAGGKGFDFEDFTIDGTKIIGEIVKEMS